MNYQGNSNDDDACIIMDAMDAVNSESVDHPTLVCTVFQNDTAPNHTITVLKQRM
jgi:hypothetical protein